jgi:hypothetical protein
MWRVFDFTHNFATMASLCFRFLKLIALAITAYKPNLRRASLKAARTCLYLKHSRFVINSQTRARRRLVYPSCLDQILRNWVRYCSEILTWN